LHRDDFLAEQCIHSDCSSYNTDRGAHTCTDRTDCGTYVHANWDSDGTHGTNGCADRSSDVIPRSHHSHDVVSDAVADSHTHGLARKVSRQQHTE